MKSTVNRIFIGLSLVTLVLFLGFVSLFSNQSELLKSFGTKSESKENPKITNVAVVLNGNINKKELSDHLLDRGVFNDPKDADCVAYWITSKISPNGIPNLGSLNKNNFRIPADTATLLGGVKFNASVSSSLEVLGYDEEVSTLYELLERHEFDAKQIVSLSDDKTLNKKSAIDSSLTKVAIQVLRTRDSIKNLTSDSLKISCIPFFGKKIADKLIAEKKRNINNQEGVPNVLVRVKEHTYNKRGTKLGYVLTDSLGYATAYLPSNGYYSFLPVRKGYEYGSSKGTKQGPLGKMDVEYSFNEKQHTIRLIDSQTYQRIKDDLVLTVRSPRDYKNSLLLYSFLFFLTWWLLFFFLFLADKYKKTQTDYVIPLAIMSITGIGLLAMFSIANPLTDTLLGSSTTIGTIFGIAFLALLSLVDWGYFYSVGVRVKNTLIQFDFVLQFINWLSTPFMKKVQAFKLTNKATVFQVLGYYVKLAISFLLIPLELILRLIIVIARGIDWSIKKTLLLFCKRPSERVAFWAQSPFTVNIPKGFGYIIIAFFFILLLYLFGDGPEGSNTKVNLFFFQPSELNKYLIVTFMAAFFAVRADRITLFSEVADSFNLRLQLKSVLLILLSLAVLLILYMVVMSDMGPALVLIVTFIFLYSIARKDFKQLLIGVGTFLIMIWIGGLINDNSTTTKFLFALFWFAGWIVFWQIKEKRLYESAIFFNFLLSAFIFLGTFMADSNIDTLQNVGQRIVNRNSVTGKGVWDNDVHGGGDQVVQGIWSLSTGGFDGQGLGKGNPNLVPAFHTDMIFTSIGEEMGWISLVLLILCLAIIIHRSLIIAYNSGNRFLFFLSSGISIVTGVQFFVIVFGAIGIIPLTGVAVPFLSFGMTSLIINLAAFGIILSVSKMNATKNQRETNRQYRYVTAVGIGSFLTASLILVCILFNYQVLHRTNYLIRPAFVSNNEGARIAEYNPRINLLIKKLGAGKIYDRNGLLLATSNPDDLVSYGIKKLIESKLIDKKDVDKLRDSNPDNVIKKLREYNIITKESESILSAFIEQKHSRKRYYPFSNHLLFMLGDENINSSLWDSDYGYFAESRLKDRLRGFSTSVRDENDGYAKFKLNTESFKPSAFAEKIDTVFQPWKKDYSELAPFLKDGVNGRKVFKWNAKTDQGERDIYLTIDANLQTTLQQDMQKALTDVKETINSRTRPKIRASVVILNAKDGDLLCSANYPLPNLDTINTFISKKKSYDKFEKKWGYHAFTERDLGTTFPTAPGSTAKVMSAIAGFMKLEDEMDNVLFHIEGSETIEGETFEPNSSKRSPNISTNYPDKNWSRKFMPTRADNCSHTLKQYQLVNLENAIVWSSNNYFINLVHNKNLYDELGELYQTIGARVGTDTSKLNNRHFPSYTFDRRTFSPNMRSEFNQWVDFTESRAIREYERRMDLHEKGVYQQMGQGALMWAWGQGTLEASPLAMARVASIVYNDGKMPITRYILATGPKKTLENTEPNVPIISKKQAELLKKYMKEETEKHRSVTEKIKNPGLPNSMGGKTGTPERYIKFDGVREGYNANDGWYICFVDSDFVEYTSDDDDKALKKTKVISTPLAIAVRLERINVSSKYKEDKGGSKNAVTFVEKVICNSLKKCGYQIK